DPGQELFEYTVITPGTMFCFGISTEYQDVVPVASAAIRWPQQRVPWGTCVGPSTGASPVATLLSGPVVAGEQRRIPAGTDLRRGQGPDLLAKKRNTAPM